MGGPLHRRRHIQGSSGPPLLRDPLLYGVVLIGLVACAPFFRYISSLGDEGVLLHAAVRILGGEVLYRDFFGILPPAGYIVVTAWMKLFGIGFASVRALAVGVIVGTAALIYAAARLSSGSRPLAALVAIAWAVLSQGALTVINHHWFTTAASMASAVGLLLVVDGAPRRGVAFAAGLFAGIAAMVSSTRGALMCVAVLVVLLTVPTSRARLLSAMAGIALFPTAMILYVAANAALAAAFDDVILYPAHHYTGIQVVPFGMGFPQHLALVALYPVAFVLAGADLALNRAALWREPRFRVSLALAIVGLLGSYPRPDHVHISFTVALACPLFALSASDVRGRVRSAVGVLLIGLCLPGLAGAIATAVTVSRTPALATVRGLIVPGRDLRAGDFAALVFQVDRVPAGNAFFFYPYSPLLPYLTGRRHAAAVDVMVPGYTSAEQFRDTCVRVASEAHWVVIDLQWSDPNFLRKIFPAMRDPDPPEKREFEAALRVLFDTIVHVSTRFELRKRSGSASATLCDKI